MKLQVYKSSKGFGLLEVMIVFIIASIMLTLTIPKVDEGIEQASKILLSDILLTQNLALSDDRFYLQISFTHPFKLLSPSIDTQILLAQPQKNMWQIQFHTSGIYTQNSYSIYNDTPRISTTTNYDGRPMSGDFIAVSPSNSQCLSGYNNTNISDFCKNNTHPNVRLKERFGIEEIQIFAQKSCKEKGGGRVYFDQLGKPYCGKNPTPLTEPFIITLKKAKAQKSIVITPLSSYTYISSNPTPKFTKEQKQGGVK
ncbi:pilus assembly FimT family protein [Helicobacter cholecystus]|nr:prepilin-type N-terminal cleavage/methylation domain-containing protein [Helicobacter cholecystus]VEJ24830.1 Tfp pilus assembly protein PilE [Helicobacter cholecystus]